MEQSDVVTPGNHGGWRQKLLQPKVWIPAAAVVVVAAVVGTVAATAGDSPRSTTPNSATSATSSESPTTSDSATPTASPSPSVSLSASPDPSISAEPWPDESPDEGQTSAYPDMTGGSLTSALYCAPTSSDAVIRSAWNVIYTDETVPAGGYGDPHPGGAGFELVTGRVSERIGVAPTIEWSPDSRGAVVFSHSERSAWLVEADGTTTRITGTYDAELLSPVRWSPDGTHLAFLAADETANTDTLVVVDVRTGKSVEVVTARHINGYDFSPDGEKVAVGLGTSTSRYRLAEDDTSLVIVDIDSGAKEELSKSGGWPAYSPDGTRLAFFGDPDGDGKSGANVANLATGELKAVGRQNAFDGYLISYWDRLTPAWSPDGTRFAAVTPGPLHTRDVTAVVAKADGSVILEGSADALHRPVWARDGRSVLIATYSDFYVLKPGSATITTSEVLSATGGYGADAMGDGFVAELAPCGTEWNQGVTFGSDLKTATKLPAPDGWLALGRPYVSPDGQHVLRVMAGPDHPRAALYLAQR